MTSECIVGVSGVHQVALLTHIDQTGPETAKDVSKVYKSAPIQEMVGLNESYSSSKTFMFFTCSVHSVCVFADG